MAKALARSLSAVWDWTGRVDVVVGRLNVLKWAVISVGGIVLVIWASLLNRFGVLGTFVLLLGCLLVLTGLVGLVAERRRIRPAGQEDVGKTIAKSPAMQSAMRKAEVAAQAIASPKDPTPHSRLAGLISEGQNLRDVHTDAFGRRLTATTDDELASGVRVWMRQAGELVGREFSDWSNLFKVDARLWGTDAGNVREYMDARLAELERIQLAAVGPSARIVSAAAEKDDDYEEEDEHEELPAPRFRSLVMEGAVELQVRTSALVGLVTCFVTDPAGATHRAQAKPDTTTMLLGVLGHSWTPFHYPVEFEGAPGTLRKGAYRVRFELSGGIFGSVLPARVYGAFRVV